MYIIDSIYDKESGYSEVTIKHKGKTFTAHSILQDVDKPHASRLTGCCYAELKAIVKALKSDYNDKKKEIKLYENFVKSVQSYKTFNAEDPSAKAMFRQLNRRRREAIAIQNEIIQVENHIELMRTQQDEINKRLDKLYASKND